MAKETSLDKAAKTAVQVISDAAEKATSAIANAALDATKLLATNAADAAKVVQSKDGTDHDLLQRLDEKVDALKDDIKGISDGTATKIQNHEIRLGKLETNNTRTNTMLTIGTAILFILASLLIYLFQTHI